jgi:hypothetical protein
MKTSIGILCDAFSTNYKQLIAWLCHLLSRPLMLFISLLLNVKSAIACRELNVPGVGQFFAFFSSMLIAEAELDQFKKIAM